MSIRIVYSKQGAVSAMSLDRRNVSLSARIRLPAWTLFAGWIGYCYTFDPGGWMAQSDVFPFVPSQVWGVGFLVASALLAWALIRHRRGIYTYALAAMLVWIGLWGLLLLYAAIVGESTPSAWAWLALVACLLWAEMVGLQGHEK